MHDRLSELLEEEVIGEVTQVGASFFDVGLGRVVLPDLRRERIDALLARLRQSFGAGLQISDQLNLGRKDQLVRGLVEVSVRSPDTSAPYLLQLTSAPLLAFYERRFLLEPELLGDLTGAFCRGLARIVEGAEAPLRLLSGFDELFRRYLELLDEAVEAARDGSGYDAAAGVAELVPSLRRAWRLIPWPLRQGLRPLSRLEQERIAPHDRVLRRTLLLAVDLWQGTVVYSYVHQHNPLEEYDGVLGWMTEIREAMVATYAPPRHAAAMARASSVDRFCEAFPAHHALVGPPLVSAEPPLPGGEPPPHPR